MNRSPLISYAKNGEDILLYRAFHTIQKGSYIDIGASEPLVGSFSELFYTMGWRGINIAASADAFEKLRLHRMWEQNLPPMSDPVSIPDELLPQETHFMKISLPCDEKSIIRLISRFEPWILLLESPDLHDNSLFSECGYALVYTGAEISIYLDQKHHGLAHCFTFPPSNLDNFITLDKWLVSEENRKLKEQIRTQNKTFQKLQNDFHASRQAYANLSHQLHLVTSSLSYRITFPLRLAAKIRRRITDIRWMVSKLKPYLARFPWIYDSLWKLYKNNTPSLSHHLSSPLSIAHIAQDRTNLLATPADSKPYLVFISPIPPSRSGIADYSLRLLGVLREHYTLLVVCEDPSAITLPYNDIKVVSSAHYLSSGSALNRHLYHFGNSDHHLWMLPLLERFSGTVVLHDLFLGGLYNALAHHSSTSIKHYLFESHGYDALRFLEIHGLHETIRTFPLNRPIIASSDAILVHSDYSYNALSTPYRFKIPFPKELPSDPISSSKAKELLGFAPSDFIVSSFGFIGPTKCARELIESWADSPLSNDTHAYLLFIGELPKNSYGDELIHLASSVPDPARIRFVGYTDAQTYLLYMASSDLIVQLRRDSRGETSAAALDALSYGRPLLVNANGTMAEFPSDVLVSIPDDFTPIDLSIALEEIHADPELRASLASSALEYIRIHHDPRRAALAYHDAIESAYAHGAFAPYRELLRTGADTEALTPLKSPFITTPTLFVDVSDVAHHDLRTGIQRVVRSILRYLFEIPSGLMIAPIRLVDGRYVHAHSFVGSFLELSSLPDETPVSMRQGDIFLGLDLYVGHIAQNAPLFHHIRSLGVHIHFVVYDILPLRFPSYFPSETYPQFLAWFKLITEVSDSLCCISDAVAQEVREYVDNDPSHRSSPLHITSFPLGADIENSAPTTGITPLQSEMLEALPPFSILMVGTIEPRKGHTQALDAFELLWVQGSDAALVIVGKAGWMVDDLIRRLRTHPQSNRRLFWFEGASDELLNLLYSRSSLLLAASYGEGFGLPLIEASRHGIPILARDLPVFREVAGERARYFNAQSPQDLADALSELTASPLLNLLYSRSSLLLAASYGEGFGLPLIEASRHGIPILARDLPVFREVAGERARYFNAQSPQDLADALSELTASPLPSLSPFEFSTWRESAHALIERITPLER